MRRPAQLMVAGALSGLLIIGVSTPVDAECPWFPIPPATEAARSAREVIVGTVIENPSGQIFDFRLRIDHVLRGPAEVGEVRRFDWLYPGWPFIENEGELVLNDQREPVPPCEPLPAWTGNVIALSLDATAPDGKTRYNAASWLSGDLPINRELPRTTLAEMQRLSALPPTDATPDPPGMAESGPSRPTVILVIIAAALLAVLSLEARRPRPAR